MNCCRVRNERACPRKTSSLRCCGALIFSASQPSACAKEDKYKNARARDAKQKKKRRNELSLTRLADASSHSLWGEWRRREKTKVAKKSATVCVCLCVFALAFCVQPPRANEIRTHTLNCQTNGSRRFGARALFLGGGRRMLSRTRRSLPV